MALLTGLVTMLACVRAVVIAPSDITASALRAKAAGLSPEVERAGLLPPRPEELGGPEDGSSRGQGGRRPADVWVPCWGLHGPRL